MHALIPSGPILCFLRNIENVKEMLNEIFKSGNASLKVAPLKAFPHFVAMFHEQSLIIGSHASFLPTVPPPQSLHRWVMFSEFSILLSLFNVWPKLILSGKYSYPALIREDFTST